MALLTQSGFGATTEALDDHEALRASEERYRVLTELNPQALWSADPDGRVLWANRRFVDYIGHDFVPHDDAEYLGCVFPEDREAVRAAWSDAVKSGTDYQIEARLFRAADGVARWWQLRALPVRNEAGAITQWLGTANDIHEQRLAHQQLHDQMEQQKRAEAALIRTEKLAAVGRMAASIAHEINNPLESVMNLIYICRERAEDPETRHLLDLADRELRRVSIITNQTLRFHKQSTAPTEVLPDDLFRTVLSLYEGRLRNSGIAVERRKRARRRVACFEGDVRQVLNNIVGNAIDAMPTGGRMLIRCRESTDWRSGERGLTLTVADSGTGMSAETRARIFEPFFTTKPVNGTGLGLWVCADIIQRHSGRILLRSSQQPAGHGTVCTIFLPFNSNASTAPPPGQI